MMNAEQRRAFVREHRTFDIPSPAPPRLIGASGGAGDLILGALLVMATTIGYLAIDRWMSAPARHAADCAGPSGLSASQAPPKPVGS